ncbi:hypothetical protein [Croceicoccus bisphenolivorans]|uniref:hypothetical protein n=1 Tax=Croceicoccus bisphenolivorans TaxID=1783232 RepID=UPI000A40EA67|nr:hypothetical protein [Croceicoccus bisphenolivorans]
MNGLLTSLAAVALLPAVTGMPPKDAERSIIVSLCAGGTMALPVGDALPDRGTTPCCAKGCRTKRRKLLDRAQ